MQRADTLLEDLMRAYLRARRRKRNSPDQLRFEMDLEENIMELYIQLRNREYRPGPSACFIAENPPVRREIFAANFRDRVVHHLVCGYIGPLFESTFVADTYASIPGRGTRFGIERLQQHARLCSADYTRPCYVLKLDIESYFMHIDRQILYDTIERTMLRMADTPAPDDGRRWGVRLDYDLLLPLLREIIFDDPTQHCILLGGRDRGGGLPPGKSLFTAPPGCGLPVGNLTSQLFSNIYLDGLDRFVQQTLGHTHYGRYVDDFYILHPDRELLKRHIREIDTYLRENLRLNLHPRKVYLQEFSRGVAFLGAVVKPHRSYISNRTRAHFVELLGFFGAHLRANPQPSGRFLTYMQSAINAYLGCMRPYKCWKIKQKLLPRMQEVLRLGSLDRDMTVFRLHPHVLDSVGITANNVFNALPFPTHTAAPPPPSPLSPTARSPRTGRSW